MLRILFYCNVFLFIGVTSLHAQKESILKFSIGNSYYQQEISTDEVFQNKRWEDLMISLEIERKFHRMFSYAVGLRYQHYRDGEFYRLPVDWGGFYLQGGAWSTTSAIEVPIKIYYHQTITQRLTLKPYVAYTVVLFPGYQYGGSSGGRSSDSNGNHFEYDSGIKKTYTSRDMGEVGGEISLRVSERWDFSFFTSWRKSFKQVGRQKINYSINGIAGYAEYAKRPQFFTIGLGVAYSFHQEN